MSVLLQIGMEESLFFLLVFVANVASKKKVRLFFKTLLLLYTLLIAQIVRVNMQ